MSTASEIERISSARNKLRAKAVSLGIGSSGDKLDGLAKHKQRHVRQSALH